MPIQTAFVVQPFTLEGRRNRRLVPLPKREVQSEQHALHQAEYLATRRAGAAALALTVEALSQSFWRLRLIEDAGGMSAFDVEVSHDPECSCRETETAIQG